jgi:glucose dehydrogenase
MRPKLATIVGLGAIATWLVVPAGAGTGTLTEAQGQASRTRGAGMTDWPLHNLDLSNTRYSPLDAINTSNAGSLAVTWSFDAGTNLGEVTPLVVNGVMYFNAGSKLFAVNAATGAAMWTTEVDPTFTASGRGPAYGDGKIYAYGHELLKFGIDVCQATVAKHMVRRCRPRHRRGAHS